MRYGTLEVSRICSDDPLISLELVPMPEDVNFFVYVFIFGREMVSNRGTRRLECLLKQGVHLGALKFDLHC